MNVGMTDLLDALDAVLPRVDPTEEAGEIVGVMARISRAATATLFVERQGALHWLAGDRVPRDTAATIRRAWKAQRQRLLTGMTITEAPAPAERAIRAWLMWMRRPGDSGLDAVYFAGAHLRPLTGCTPTLLRLAALLVGVQAPRRGA